MKKNIFLLAPVFLFLALASCTKESRHNYEIGDRLKMIQGTKWRITNIVDNGVSAPADCRNDDIWVFNVNGEGYIDDGGISCGVMDSLAFAYSITGDQRFLYLRDMAAKTYGSYHTDSERLDTEITYMTSTELGIKYYDQGTNPSTSHQYEIAFARIQ